jgi:hypothetical protein
MPGIGGDVPGISRLLEAPAHAYFNVLRWAKSPHRRSMLGMAEMLDRALN